MIDPSELLGDGFAVCGTCGGYHVGRCQDQRPIEQPEEWDEEDELAATETEDDE